MTLYDSTSELTVTDKPINRDKITMALCQLREVSIANCGEWTRTDDTD